MHFKDKVVIVTGASSGIGLEAAKQLNSAGAKVVLVAQESPQLQQTGKAMPNALVVPTDMTDEASVKGMVQTAYVHFGRIDVLLNNAGKGYESPLEFVDSKTFVYLFKLHVTGPLAAMQAVIPIMRKQGSGRIINTSSPTAKLILPGIGAYSTTKAALRYMTLVSRKELAKDNIHVSVFYPFITSSNFGKSVFLAKGMGMATMSGNDRNLPDPDSPEFTASKLVAAIASDKKEIVVRGLPYFIFGILKKKLSRKTT
jgi:NADP-dependent 3-hydroxy acid dehydrogenase YdfG